jgi:acyl-CoA reductase-like NAD-dependent aldehyde dehydrogenase
MYDVLGRVAGQARRSDATMPITDKFSAAPVGRLHVSSGTDLDDALRAAAGAAREAPLTGRERATILREAAGRVRDAAAELCQHQCVEVGFTWSDAQREVARAVDTLLLSAEEANRFGGEEIPLGAASGVPTRIGLTIRKPVGVVAALTPFNSPVNGICHKIGPAIAAGNGVVVKPAETSPSTAVVLADAFADAGLPSPWLHVLHGPGPTVGAALVADPRVNFIAFTGSTVTGRSINEAAGLRRTQLELGSISCTVVADDAVLDDAMIANCANAAFRKAGQVCTSIQRIYVHRDREKELTSKLVECAAQLPAGNPAERDTIVGPLISLAAAERVERWIQEAADGGAEVLTGGKRHGTVVEPTVLSGVVAGMALHDQEAFGPVVCLYPYDSDEEVIEAINGTPYGLASGLFTHNLDRAMRMAYQLDVGSLHVNSTSSSRVDIMPYGGLKASGHGQEGPRYAVRELSVETLLSLEWSK